MQFLDFKKKYGFGLDFLKLKLTFLPMTIYALLYLIILTTSCVISTIQFLGLFKLKFWFVFLKIKINILHMTVSSDF